MLRTCSTAALLAALAGFAFALPQDDAAAAGPSFQVQARLRIDAARAQRVRLFREVVGRLQAAGLRKDEGWEREEFYTDSLSGQMPARGLAALRRDPAVSAAIAIPANYQAPEAGALVRLYLLTDFGPDGQREAAGKARAALANLGFRESVGYDHDSHRQLLGRLPLARLEALLGDALQIEIPVVPATGSLKSMKQHLVKLAEVLPEPGELPPAAMESAVPPAGLPQGKVHPDLRRAISEAGEGGAGQKLRVEVILRDVPTGPVTAARLGVLGLGLEIQGQVGPMLFATLPAGNVTKLASLADVSGIRLPQPARYVAWPSDFTSVSRTPAAVESSPARWLRQGGNNVVAVVAADFSGWEEEVGKELPKNTKLIDLTPELSADLESAAPPAPGDFGVKLAKEVAAALPGTDLLLVRVDSASPFQVTEIARVTSGQLWLTGAFAQRLEEITTERARLVARKEYLQVRRRIALNNFGLEGDDKEAREAYMKEQAQFDEDSKALGAKDARALAFRAATKQLAGVGSVVVGLAWDVVLPRPPGKEPPAGTEETPAVAPPLSLEGAPERAAG